MNQQFYNQFNSANKNIIAIFGDRFKTSLINLLSDEVVKMGKHVFILAETPIAYPLAGKVMVCDELAIVSKLIDDNNPNKIYLASKIKNDLLHPFTKKDINKLAGNLSEKNILVFDIDSKSKINFKNNPYLKVAQLICSINYNLLNENLPEISKIKDLKSKSIDEQVSDKVYSIIKKTCPHFIEIDQVKDKVCFIDQVKGLYDENVIRSIGRNLKSKMDCKILIGNSNTFQVKAI